MLRSWFIVVALVVSGFAPLLAGQDRTFEAIPTPGDEERPEPVPEHLAPPLPTRAECEEAARGIAAAYGPDDLAPRLHEKFPNRFRLLDDLKRVDLRVSRLELSIDAVEDLEILPWSPDHEGRRRRGEKEILVSDCLIEVRTGLAFDDVTTGERRILPGRSRWRIRFTREATP